MIHNQNSIMTKSRSVLFGLSMILFTLVIGVLAAPLAFSRRAVRGLGVFWIGTMMLLLRVIVGLRYEIRHPERLPQGDGLIAAKHQSAWETLIFVLLLRPHPPAYILKRELLSIPIFGWYARRYGLIPINRQGGAGALRQMVRKSVEALQAHRTVIIFPEGTRTPPGEHRRYHPGVAALYEGLGQPIIPVALNSGLFWGKGLLGKRPGTIVMEVLDPLPPGLPRGEMMGRLAEAITTATNRLEREALETKEPGEGRGAEEGADGEGTQAGSAGAPASD